MSKKIYILIGPPGSGKGTQATLLQKEFDLNVIGSGSILRQQIKNRTRIGKIAKKFVEDGDLVPSMYVIPLILKKIKNSTKDILLDGFPRTLNQFKQLEEFINENKGYMVKLLEIKISIPKLQQRVGGRWHCHCGEIFHTVYRPPNIEGICDVCHKKLFRRRDEGLNVLKNRILIFRKRTMPLVRFAKNHNRFGYYFVDGNANISEVNKSLRKFIK